MSAQLRNTKDPIVGIIGGMGPEATVELFRRIVTATSADRDQDHLRILIDNNPHIPDRTAAILGTGPDPLPALTESAKLLECAGASLLVMPCNTAHHWLQPLRQSVSVPVLDMIVLTVARIRTELREPGRIGILATEGTVHAGLYQRRLQSAGYTSLLPYPDAQRLVTEVIRTVKTGSHGAASKLSKVGEELEDRGARGLVLGCTELSVLAGGLEFAVDTFDPLQILAAQTVAVMHG